MIYGAVIACVQKDLDEWRLTRRCRTLGFIVLGTFAFSARRPYRCGLADDQPRHHRRGPVLADRNDLRPSRDHVYCRLERPARPGSCIRRCFHVVVMSSIGVPGLNGFVGEFLILLGTFVTHRWWAVVGTVAVVLRLSTCCGLTNGCSTARPTKTRSRRCSTSPVKERLVMAPLAVLIVFLGVYPTRCLDRIQPSVDRILTDARVPRHHRIFLT